MLNGCIQKNHCVSNSFLIKICINITVVCASMIVFAWYIRLAVTEEKNGLGIINFIESEC